MDGYVMHSVDGEIMLVVRSYNEDEILRAIKRIQAARDKATKEMGLKLEQEFNDRPKRNDGKPQPKNTKKSATSKRSPSRPATRAKRRAKPST